MQNDIPTAVGRQSSYFQCSSHFVMKNVLHKDEFYRSYVNLQSIFWFYQQTLQVHLEKWENE